MMTASASLRLLSRVRHRGSVSSTPAPIALSSPSHTNLLRLVAFCIVDALVDAPPLRMPNAEYIGTRSTLILEISISQQSQPSNLVPDGSPASPKPPDYHPLPLPFSFERYQRSLGRRPALVCCTINCFTPSTIHPSTLAQLSVSSYLPVALPNAIDIHPIILWDSNCQTTPVLGRLIQGASLDVRGATRMVLSWCAPSPGRDQTRPEWFARSEARPLPNPKTTRPTSLRFNERSTWVAWQLQKHQRKPVVVKFRYLAEFTQPPAKTEAQQHAAALPSTVTELNFDAAQRATTNSDTNPASDSELDSDWEEESDEGGDEPLRPMWDELDSHGDVLAQNDAHFVESEHFDVENVCAGDAVVEGDGVDLTQPALLDILSDSPVTLDSCGITSQEKVTKSTKGKGFDLTNISFTM
ncbi:hypothetical protein EW146_g6006 [Bondarzewia mesenterica]|uniref:Uncharacterized protein n=1 Tax=Bondarzewia mesenterica TaxID=1095465 RepID=A0A4S4LPR3_9AGAM|nr:hypothetical protein EW146_g6006 [Bondarzewia mesenterica]